MAVAFSSENSPVTEGQGEKKPEKKERKEIRGADCFAWCFVSFSSPPDCFGLLSGLSPNSPFGARRKIYLYGSKNSADKRR